MTPVSKKSSKSNNSESKKPSSQKKKTSSPKDVTKAEETPVSKKSSKPNTETKTVSSKKIPHKDAVIVKGTPEKKKLVDKRKKDDAGLRTSPRKKQPRSS